MTATDLRSDMVLAEGDFRDLAAIVMAETGIALSEGKRPMLQSRLLGRLRALGLDGFSAYLALIAAPQGEAERQELVSAVTTNVTGFFREEHHFRHLEQIALPPLVALARARGRVRIWSSACSTGEEPWSIAATLRKLCPEAGTLDLRILASDVDRKALARAEAGQYDADALAALSAEARRLLFAGQGGAIHPDLRAALRFRQLNLIGPWPMQGGFQVIFCRNVVIYFDKPTQERLWQRFAEAIPPGGWLYIGHSERITGPAAAHFAPEGVTTYRRI
ncbi:CheR family methyltransferase [Paragemmobacter straminiformis]|uniref:Chemotaxis protein methyltransferase n=1 Tax=Paragemmobacter straminiformis TaxID=2045119 RepID=A0A842IBK9_9RHOB|nr:CheR family methyltransferase [Gemmobacter straminiformis]MBC2836737.1 chemotaxis protein [Gemmobacter straminiformis]